MGYYTVESGASKKIFFTAFSMSMAKEFCIEKLRKSPKARLMICKGIYVKYDVYRLGKDIIFNNRDTGVEKTITVF